MVAPTRKQTSDHAEWLAALDTVRERIPAAQVDALVEQAAERIQDAQHRFGPLAYCWSGGKDSQALRVPAEQAGVTECCLVICELEYPEFLQWATDHMPAGLQIVNTGQDLAWLARHNEMLFPRDAATAAKWFHVVQHKGQAQYQRERRFAGLLLGRRRQDGNFVGRRGEWWYRNREGIVRVSPIYDWTNDECLAVIAHRDLPLAPCYGWPRGFRVGTGPWPARQWTGGHAAGWSEVYTIDPSIVRQAANVFSTAEAFLATVE